MASHGMFRFKLQTILDVRKTMEDKVLSELSQVRRELQKEKEVFESIRLKKKELINTFRDLKGKNVVIGDIAMHSENIKRCQKEEFVQKERVREAKLKVNIKKEELLEATKKRKAMEILKTKQFEEYQSELNILERSAIDEMAIVRHNRRLEE
jgi:flagellar FliJ protein